MSEERRHIAILFSDIVSYTKLMGSDENKALDMLSRNRMIHETHIKQFNGTLIKDIGDAILGSFNLASDAVRCAIEIQKSCKDDNIPLKIGIHEGEVVFRDSDLFGDGINIASRLQSDAQQGCINISGSVYRDVKNKPEIRTSFIGDKMFKNVDEPIKVYKILCEGEDGDHSTTETKTKSKNPYYIMAGIVIVAIIALSIWKSIPSREIVELEKSIAVLPLKYLSEDQSKEYLANGVMDAITGHLSKIDSLIVRPRTSVEQYRDTDKTMQVIGDELGVSYLIEGSFLMIDNQVKLTIQLINVKDDNHMYYEEYDRDYSDIMAVQSEVAQTIAKEIKVAITPETREVIETNPTTDLTAYDYYMKGKEYLERQWERDDFTTIQKLQKAEEMYEEAVKIDSTFVLAWVGLAIVNGEMFFYNPKYRFHPKHLNYSKEDYLKDIHPQIQEIKGYLDKAIALAPDMLEVKLAEAYYYGVCQNDLTKAIQIRKELHAQYPNDEQIVRSIAYNLFRLDEYQKSLTYFRKALSLNPTEWLQWNMVGRILQIQRRYEEAVKYYKKAALLDISREGFSDGLFNLYLDRRKINEAKQYLAEHQDILNEDKLKRCNRRLLWAEGYFDEAIQEWERSPIDTTTASKGFLGYSNLGRRYIHIGQKEKASEYYLKAKDIFESLPDRLKNQRYYARYATVLAGLGMTTEALDTINKVIEVIGFWSESKVDYFDIHWERTLILAMSNDHDALFDQLIYILDRYGGRVCIEEFKCNPSQVKCDPFWSRFEEYERFQEIINDPKYQEIPLED